MSGYNYESDADLEESGSSGGGLRKLLEETLAENKRLREAIEKPQRQASVGDLLKDKGIDPALAAIVPEDTDPSEWIEKYAHLLGATDKVNLEDVKAVEETQVQVAEDSDPAIVAEREALAAMQDAAESGVPTAAVANDLLAQMDKITDEDELLKFFQRH